MFTGWADTRYIQAILRHSLVPVLDIRRVGVVVHEWVVLVPERYMGAGVPVVLLEQQRGAQQHQR